VKSVAVKMSLPIRKQKMSLIRSSDHGFLNEGLGARLSGHSPVKERRKNIFLLKMAL
jgi:hypothetical protein